MMYCEGVYRWAWMGFLLDRAEVAPCLCCILHISWTTVWMGEGEAILDRKNDYNSLSSILCLCLRVYSTVLLLQTKLSNIMTDKLCMYLVQH